MGNIVKTCLLIYTFIYFNTSRWCSCNGYSSNNSTLRCIPSERAALLNFKHNLTYFDENVSSSWKGEECCNWSGILCDDTTGHILELDLGGNDTIYLLKMEKLESSLVYLLELKQLESLDLSYNDISYSSIPLLMGSMKQLRYLSLSSSSLGGLVPYELGNLTNLQVLDLSYNMLSGEIPTTLGNLSKIKVLNLYNNTLGGKLPTSIGKLSNLQTFYISYNPLEGTVSSETHFANLSSLIELCMGETMLTLNLSSDWVPPFQLQYFYARNCKINGQFPLWLQTQKNLSYLELSNANISGIMPSWFHTMQHLDTVDLSNNNLSGCPIFPIRFYIIILSNNSLSGECLTNGSKTKVYLYAYSIILSNNFASGSLLDSLVHTMPNMQFVTLSNNQISGQIPYSLCQLTSLRFLEIQHNSLSGEIPNCLANLSSLSFIGLSYNNFKGHIPCFNNSDSNQFGLPMEFYLQLNDNMLSGEIPSCLTNFTNLNVLDVGGNQLSGKMLKWFDADKFRELQVLRLRGNRFSGIIPKQICSLPRLQIMDFGHNHFTGSIPLCLSNITSMISPSIASWEFVSGVGVSEVMQGIERSYTRTLPYFVDIDLSYNNLVGS